MDAIEKAENEVDKVLQRFSTYKESCGNKIDQLIQSIQNAKQDLNQLSTPEQHGLNSQQTNLIRIICDKIQKSCTEITNSHRELHVPVSKIGKTIDKNFSADFGCVAEPELFRTEENKRLLNHAIVQHFLRNGMASIADELIKEANITVDPNEIAKFERVEAIVSSLRGGDVKLALDWAVTNRKRLQELNSPLEFYLHRMKVVDLFKEGMDKKLAVVHYCRDAMKHSDPVTKRNLPEFIAYIIKCKIDFEDSPYKSFLDPTYYCEIEDIFVSNYCALLNFSSKSPISVAVDAGCVALPALLNINQILSTQGVQNVWRMRDELPVEIDLGRKLQFHSTFSCPILKQQSNENNPPMRLVCGHVISRDALHKLSNNSAGNKLKCPYCPMEQVLTDAKQIHF